MAGLMDIPWRPLLLSSVAGSFVLHKFSGIDVVRNQAHWIIAVALFFGQFSIWATWKVILYPKFFSPLRHLPGPKENPSWFNGQWNRVAKESPGAPHLDWINTIPNKGIIRYLGLFNQERIMLTTPEALREVLTQKGYEIIKPQRMILGLARILGIGILLAEGDVHRMQRKNLSPAFAFRHIKDLYPIFWAKSRELAQTLTKRVEADSISSDSKSAPSAVVEVADWCSRATLDIIGIAGMGQDFGTIQDPNTELSLVYGKVFKPSQSAQMLQLAGMFLPHWLVQRLPVERNGEVDAAAELIKQTCRDLIAAKRTRLEKKESTEVDILSVALESGGFSDANLVDQMMTFLAAGHETTSSALTWAIYLLCLHPQVQEELRAEIQHNLASLDDQEAPPITPAAIDKLPYLNAVCQETLRFYPSVPLTVREVTRGDSTIIGQPIPKGTLIFISPWAVNKSIELWGPDAAEFQPARWLGPGRANTGGASSAYAFLTFLHGPRGCIGQSFARAEFACLLAGLVGRFRMELADPNFELKIKGGITARPANGLPVRLTVCREW